MIYLLIIGIIIMLLALLYLRPRMEPLMNKDESLRKLVRQAARWALAAEQDESPIVAVLHSNYAAGYLWAIKDIAGTDEVKKATGVDYSALESEITGVQDTVTKQLAGVCPAYVGENVNKYLSAVAGKS